MKTSYGLLALLFFCVLSAEEDLLAQRFQAIYGTPLNNTFTKVLRSGTDYYVLGSDQPSAGAQDRATVTRLDAQGQLQWTLRLDIASQWNDAVVTPNGDLLVVGHTLPFDANSQSLAARVTPVGSFSWSRSYNVPGRETFHRVVRNPNPNNAAYPYYIVGIQKDPTNTSVTWDDVVLLTLSDAGNLGWKKIYSALLGSSTDDEFARDLEVLPNGDLLLAGNWDATAVLLRADNTGAVVGGVSPGGTQMSFADVAQAGSGFIAVGHQFPIFSAWLMKFDAGFLPLWQVSLPFLTAIRQVWTLGNSIYVTGSALVGGFDQGVVLKFQDGASAPTLQWMKYLQKGETAYTGGTAWPLPNGDIAFADGRASGAYFGGFCAFLSVSDPDMNTCMTKTETRAITNTNFSFNSPCCLNISLTSEPITANNTMSVVNWREEDVCPKVCPPQCRVGTIDISTGADPLNAGAFLAAGGTDPSWMVVAAPPNAGLTTFPQPASLIGAYPGWAKPPSTWISAFPFSNYGTNNCAGGVQNCSCPPFVYERRFCVCERTEATFAFDFYTDNNGNVELWREGPITGSPVFVALLADNCPKLDVASNFSQPLAVNITLLLLPGRYILRINNWNISGGAMGANLHGTVTGLGLEKDECCLPPMGSLCVTKYHDLDCDSIRDIKPTHWAYIDPGLPNWAFQVAGLTSSYTGVTNQQGQVCFTGLTPGTYTVTEILQQGWIPSLPAGGSATVTVGAYSTTNVHFGNCTDSCSCGPYEFLYGIGKGPLNIQNCGDVLFVPSNLPFQFLPSFSCSGNCTNPPTVDYVLTGPPGFATQSASGVPIAGLPITAATFTIAGTYHLTLIGHCDGKLCPCELTFVFPGDCCKDYSFFSANVQSFVSVTADNANCKATLSIGNLPVCDYLEWIDWGDGSPKQYGPFKAGDMAMHTYAKSGAYAICYLAIEKEPATGLICFEKVACDTVFLSCADSWCPYNYAQNGDFELGAPTPSDQDICRAVRWCGIWSQGSTADYYSTLPPTTPPGTTPIPVGQGKFGAMWCRKQGNQRVWREGMMNELQQTILPSSGCYRLEFKMACTGFYFGTPILNAYGVYAPGGLASGTSPIDGNLPPNLGLFPPGAAVQLGSHTIPSTCNNDFANPAQQIAFSFNSALLPPTGITHIFFTRDDATNGGVFLAIDDVCLKKVSCPPTCTCGGFSKLYVRNTPGSLNQPITCGGSPVVLPCYPGYGYHLTGAFQCDGTDCPDEHQINWTLSGPGGSHSGGFTDDDPFFGIHLLPTYFHQPGLYTLTMNGNCGTSVCSCTVRFVVDCPPLCPCDSSTIQALQANTAKGFATAVSIASCKACFSPLALSDCETVEWHISSTSGTPIGTTVGKQTFCYTFPAPGTYTVIMVVSRKRPDGSLCEVFTHSQRIILRCLGVVDCVGPKLSNAGFNVKPVAGPLSSGGAAPGWRQAEGTGEPHDVHLIEYPDSQDGWVMGLTGSYTGAGVLHTEAPLCVSKSDTGTLTVTLRTLGDPIPGVSVKVGRKPPGGNAMIILYTGNTVSWPGCSNASCYALAALEGLLPFDDDDWYELRIPYNLSDWQALDSCGDFFRGIPARMAVYVGNYLGEEQQSVGPTRDAILIDNICFRGMTVNTEELTSPSGFLLYPNPTTGRLTLELPAPAAPGTTIRITEPNGRIALEVAAEMGGEQQQVQVGSLPTGMYFVHLLQAGRVVGAERFVKH